jgi:hypothetical protein
VQRNVRFRSTIKPANPPLVLAGSHTMDAQCADKCREYARADRLLGINFTRNAVRNNQRER